MYILLELEILKVETLLYTLCWKSKINRTEKTLAGTRSADPVIEAIARLEFEDGLRMGVLPGGCWCPWGGRTYPRINFKTP